MKFKTCPIVVNLFQVLISMCVYLDIALEFSDNSLFQYTDRPISISLHVCNWRAVITFYSSVNYPFIRIWQFNNDMIKIGCLWTFLIVSFIFRISIRSRETDKEISLRACWVLAVTSNSSLLQRALMLVDKVLLDDK